MATGRRSVRFSNVRSPAAGRSFPRRRRARESIAGQCAMFHPAKIGATERAEAGNQGRKFIEILISGTPPPRPEPQAAFRTPTPTPKRPPAAGTEQTAILARNLRTRTRRIKVAVTCGLSAKIPGFPQIGPPRTDTGVAAATKRGRPGNTAYADWASSRIELIPTKSRGPIGVVIGKFFSPLQDDEQASRNGQDDLDASPARERAHARFHNPAGRHKTGRVGEAWVGQQCAEVLNKQQAEHRKKARQDSALGGRDQQLGVDGDTPGLIPVYPWKVGLARDRSSRRCIRCEAVNHEPWPTSGELKEGFARGLDHALRSTLEPSWRWLDRKTSFAAMNMATKHPG